MPFTSTSKRGTRDQQTKLRGLAGAKGYDVEHALRSDGGHDLDSAGKKLSAPDGHVTFTIVQALVFLKTLPRPERATKPVKVDAYL